MKQRKTKETLGEDVEDRIETIAWRVGQTAEDRETDRRSITAATSRNGQGE